MARLSQSWLIWLAVYVGLLGGIAVGMILLQQRVVGDLGSDQNRESWQEWRGAAAKEDGKHGPVKRVIPPSEEPPMLVLLRDHFPMIFVAAVFFPAIIIGFLMLALRGVLIQSAERKSFGQAKSENASPLPPNPAP